MGIIIRHFSDGSVLEFDKGRFDNWCVYLTCPHQARYAPGDVQYFTSLVQHSKKYGAKKMYGDFVKIYEKTGRSLEAGVLDLIASISETYHDDRIEVEILLSILYAAMIAEENKRKKVLGKRLKRLGVHQCLMEGVAPEKAAVFSKGKHVPELAPECKKRGF